VRETEVNTRIEAELSRAMQARASGLEGQARVCARRAAGLAIRSYLEDRGETVLSSSVMDVLEFFRTRSEISPRMRATAEHLLTRVNQNYSLDIPVDLIAETRWLVDTLETSE